MLHYVWFLLFSVAGMGSGIKQGDVVRQLLFCDFLVNTAGLFFSSPYKMHGCQSVLDFICKYSFHCTPLIPVTALGTSDRALLSTPVILMISDILF